MNDKAHIEAICNNPLLRVWTAYDGAPPSDATPHLTAPSFVILVDEGCFIAQSMGSGRYCVHTMLLPQCRGANAIRVARAALEFAFTRTDMVELVTMAPISCPQGGWFARAMGMRKLFQREKIWPKNGFMCDVDFYGLSIDDWILSGACGARGEWFHDELERQAPELPRHRPDRIHDCYVGYAVSAVLKQQVVKGIHTFNHWARLAFYQPIKVLSLEPLLLDITSCVLRVREDSFTVENRNA